MIQTYNRLVYIFQRYILFYGTSANEEVKKQKQRKGRNITQLNPHAHSRSNKANGFSLKLQIQATVHKVEFFEGKTFQKLEKAFIGIKK